MIDSFTEATGSNNSIQTDSYINNENIDNTIAATANGKFLKRLYVIPSFNTDIICQ